MLVGKLFIHRYVYENEILVPKQVRNQIDQLIQEQKAEIVDSESLIKESHVLEMLYQEAIQLLQNGDKVAQYKYKGKNWGEIVSVAYAYVKEIPFIFSDERLLQELCDTYIDQTAKSLKVVRLVDFICKVKELGVYSRREVYKVWCLAHSDNLEWAKKKLSRISMAITKNQYMKIVSI